MGGARDQEIPAGVHRTFLESPERKAKGNIFLNLSSPLVELSRVSYPPMRSTERLDVPREAALALSG